jgi:hypothetical protein
MYVKNLYKSINSEILVIENQFTKKLPIHLQIHSQQNNQ